MPLQASTSSSGHDGFWKTIRAHLNFFRIHVIFFTLTPLIFSGIFYASNGKYPVAYIDALFNSVSAMTVCGLATVNLSQLTAWQQVLLFMQMCIGNPVIVSWVVVYTRRYYFAKKLDYIIQAEVARRAAVKVEQQLATAASVGTSSGTRGGWSSRIFRRKSGLSTVPEDSSSNDTRTTPKENATRPRPDMIRLMDASPKLISPSGYITVSGTDPTQHISTKYNATSSYMQAGERAPSPRHLILAGEISRTPEQIDVDADVHVKNIAIVSTDPGRSTPEHTHCPSDQGALKESPTSVPKTTTIHSVSNLPHASSATQGAAASTVSPGMPRTASVDFAATVSRAHPSIRGRTHHPDSPSSEISPDISPAVFSASGPRRRRSSAVPQNSHVPMARHPTTQTHRSSDSRHAPSVYPPHSFEHVDQPQEKMLRGFGGFPMPHELLGMLFRRLFPRLDNRLKRTLTIPVTTTLTGAGLGRTMSGATCETGRPTRGGSISAPEGSKPVTYISFDAVVGPNSAFRLSTNEQLEELGGVEYRALNALLWLVAVYHLAIQLISFVVIAPYMSMSKWKSDFEPPAQFRPVPPPWFSLFQVVSAYTNTGTSLVDQSMVPFQTAYPMIFFMMLCILAGNTAYPVLLRFFIWVITKLVPRNSQLQETLHFLLDHPRRCFFYLFPSHQTWFLLSVLVILNFTDWFCFMVLDIDNPDIESIPLGTRFVAGLLQAISVRAAGFGIVPLANIAPAVKVVYVVMMYVSVYPIALSVRSTNVYEEQSLGVYKHDDEEAAFSTAGTRMTVWSRYMAMHARRQLSFDMWWLCLALILVCIIERGNLNNTEIQGWFNIFTITFELVSAYGTVGLSLGIPTENYSFSGALHPLSKLIVCLVMLRGRHRGLPVAIDRAILLPSELAKMEDKPEDKPIVHDDRRSSTSSECLPSPPKDGVASNNGECFEGRLKGDERCSSSYDENR